MSSDKFDLDKQALGIICDANYNVMYPLYTVTEVSGILKINRNNICHMIEDGRLGAIRVNGNLRVRPIDIENFIKRCQINPNR